MRVVYGLLLSLCLAATSMTMAVARGQARVDGVVVLCTGTGPLAVAVDADGKPIKGHHICPDCALTLFAGMVAAPVPVFSPLSFSVVPFTPEADAVPPQPGALRPFARGPPSLI
ncbi:DUF2946 family protein [Frigidibacter sp. ROC022]|uniref:DUF2946 family protein n=1 Tax=Frigidibacter sp. ROC022 TaxID=2971796 RepID=UPI00215AF92D|nr:DUF2946 family protein [Frigidibacter sp. ROC022]MCR8722994.1 hypothetical protein [Frigidibacter sp. ROC022]